MSCEFAASSPRWVCPTTSNDIKYNHSSNQRLNDCRARGVGSRVSDVNFIARRRPAPPTKLLSAAPTLSLAHNVGVGVGCSGAADPARSMGYIYGVYIHHTLFFVVPVYCVMNRKCVGGQWARRTLATFLEWESGSLKCCAGACSTASLPSSRRNWRNEPSCSALSWPVQNLQASDAFHS